MSVPIEYFFSDRAGGALQIARFADESEDGDDDASDEDLVALLSLIETLYGQAAAERFVAGGGDKPHNLRYLSREVLRSGALYADIPLKMDDAACLKLFHITLASFCFLRDKFAERAARNAMQSAAAGALARPRRRAFNPTMQISIALRYLCSTAGLTDLALFAHRTISTMSRHVRYAFNILLDVLRDCNASAIEYPGPRALPRCARLMQALLPASLRQTAAMASQPIVAAIDGTFITKGTAANGAQATSWYANYTYRGTHALNNLLLTGADGLIWDYVATYDGAAGDSATAAASLSVGSTSLLDRIQQNIGVYNYSVAADSGFPATGGLVRRLNNMELAYVHNRFGAIEREHVERKAYELHVSQRVAEWSGGALKHSWLRLVTKLPDCDKAWSAVLIETCLRLSNFRVRRDGIGMVTNAVLNHIEKN